MKNTYLPALILFFFLLKTCTIDIVPVRIQLGSEENSVNPENKIATETVDISTMEGNPPSIAAIETQTCPVISIKNDQDNQVTEIHFFRLWRAG